MNANEIIETMSKLVMSMMCYAHTMTAKTTFEAVFASSNEIHLGYYINLQWAMWLATPLMFAKAWPLQFRMLVTVYDRMEYIRLSMSDDDTFDMEAIEAICAKAFKDCVFKDENGNNERLE